MKHIILGTAGHVDHGKTALIKALTGKDCDTHKEEKRRGITINLGFAKLDLATGESIGIVDVPGHGDFIRTMVAGSSGIDFGLLVIAADSGVMPQTQEHLQIMEMLGIKRGLVVITKIDLVEKDFLELVEEDVEGFVKDTFLMNRPVVHVSSKTGEGIEKLLSILGQEISKIENRLHTGVFRLYADRSFSIAGFGTVVTGSVISGQLDVEDQVFLFPGSQSLRVRRLERHGEEVKQIVAGDRASLNLSGLKKEDVERGMLISNRRLLESFLVDAQIQLFPKIKTLNLWTRVSFHIGTLDCQARIHLIDTDKLKASETGVVQIHLERPLITSPGDRFIIRNTSNDQTLGGGEVVDPFPLHHRRRKQDLVKNLSNLADKKLPGLISATSKRLNRPVSMEKIASLLNLSKDEIGSALKLQKEQTQNIFFSEAIQYVIDADVLTELKKNVIKELTQYHKVHKLQGDGRTTEEILGILKLSKEDRGLEIINDILNIMAETKEIRKSGKSWVLGGHEVALDETMSEKVNYVESILLKQKLEIININNLKNMIDKKFKINDQELNDILQYLRQQNKVHHMEGSFLHDAMVSMAREKLVTALKKDAAGLTVAQFRDLIQGNRRNTLFLFALFESEKIVVRKGDVRILTK